VKVEELRIDQSDLNTQRMMDLMGVNTKEGMPLYLHAISRILREMRIQQQAVGGSFDYAKFKNEVEVSGMSPAQKAPLQQHLDTLESFMPISKARARTKKWKRKGNKSRGTVWTTEVSQIHNTR